jgi:hypothetical protein
MQTLPTVDSLVGAFANYYGFRFVLSLNYAEASMLKDGADHEPSWS